MKNQICTTGADAGMRDLHLAAVANDALVLGAFVLATSTFPIALGTENAFAKQPIFLWPVRAVVDRFRLLDFPEGPAPDVVGRSQHDPDAAVVVDAVVNVFSHS